MHLPWPDKYLIEIKDAEMIPILTQEVGKTVIFWQG